MSGSQINKAFISFPKSGRTWMKAMYGKYICDHLNMDDKNLFDFSETSLIQKLKEETKLPLIDAWTHDQTFDGVKMILTNPNEFQDLKVIFMRRDLRDTMVSYFYHNKHRSSDFRDILKDVSIDEFLSIPYFSPESIIRYYETMEMLFQSLPIENVLVIDYEKCLIDPRSEFERVLNHTDMPIDLIAIFNAVNMGKFSNLKKLEEGGYFPNSILHKKSDDTQSAKVRVGKVGQHKIDLSKETIERFDKLIGESKCTLIPRYE